MYSNYFEKLIAQARYLDDGIEKLNRIWEMPHVLIGGFAKCTEETDSHINGLWDVIKATQNEIEGVLEEMDKCKSQDSASIEHLFQETRREYASLKEQCDSLESVLAEYGYHYNEDDTPDQISPDNSKEFNCRLDKQMKYLEVEFTPNLSWKREIRQTEQLHDRSVSSVTMTPVIANLSSIKSYACTPIREPPEEPIYSKHFYQLLKK